MAPTESFSVTSAASAFPRQGWRSVVWLRGDHDISSMADLSESFAAVIAIDDADVVADLSQVTYMGAETVGVLVRARQFLFLRSRSLEFRSPSTVASRVLELCAVELLDDHPPLGDVAAVGSAAALGTWVAVPATGRGERLGATSRTLHLPRPDSRRPGRVVIAKRVPPGVLLGATASVERPIRREAR